MASGDIITKVADKDTLDRTYANTNAILAAVGEDVKIKGVKRYGMKINKNDSNPATRCTYLFDAVGMTPAAMNYSAGRFDFGDWGDVFFVKNNYPAMVKYDGTEDYKLDPNDHTKKADGTTASDVSNTAYGGNAMSVFDGSGDKGKIWLSQFEIGNYEYMIISNVQYDESYNDDAYVRRTAHMRINSIIRCSAVHTTEHASVLLQDRRSCITRTHRQRLQEQRRTVRGGISAHGANETC